MYLYNNIILYKKAWYMQYEDILRGYMLYDEQIKYNIIDINVYVIYQESLNNKTF